MPRRAFLTIAWVLAASACGDSSRGERSCAFLGIDALATCAASAVTPMPEEGAPDAERVLLRPQAFVSGGVDVALAEGERAAVFLLNAGGRDGATARLAAANVAAPPGRLTWQAQALTAAPAPALHPPGDAGVLEVALSTRPTSSSATALRRTLTAAAAPPERTTFCVLSSAAYTDSARRAGRLVAQGTHGLVYVDEAALAELSVAEAAELAAAFDGRIHPALTSLLGPASDVDGNGKVILFVTRLPELFGYYWARDVLDDRDGSAGCDGSRSNGMDAVYLALPSAVTRLGWTRAQALGEILPGVLAHEFAHLLSFQRRCLARACLRAEETWIEEGLAKVAEDEAGYGWNLSRASGVAYLTRTRESVYRGYDGRSLTRWEGDSVGNYEGAHAFFRYHADRLGPDVLAALTSGPTGIANVERALGTTFPQALADVATALLFSNGGATPAEAYSFTGSGWTPLEEKLRRLDTVPLGDATPAAAAMRTDGWNAFLTGPAGAGGGTVRIESTEAVKPWVAVVRFRGEP